MQLVDFRGEEYKGKDIILENVEGKVYIKKNENISIKINNVLSNSEYTLVSYGDVIEIIEKKILLHMNKDTSNILVSNTKVCQPFIIPEYEIFPESTAMMGILLAHNNLNEWLYNNFLLIWSSTRIMDEYHWCDFVLNNETIKFKKCPMIYERRLSKSDIENKDSVIINSLKNILKHNYIFISLDMIVVDGWWSDNDRYHCSHPAFIYGYDEKEKKFFCSDFLQGRYKKFSLSYDEMLAAYRGGEDFFIKWQYRDIRIERNDQLVISQIKSFIQGKNPINNYLSLLVYFNTKYGFDALECIGLNLKVCLETYKKIDLRSIHLIKVHNQLMLNRITYWESKTELNKGSQISNAIKLEKEIINSVNLLEMLCIKNNIRPNKSDKAALINRFAVIVQEMKEIYQNILLIFDSSYVGEKKDYLWGNWDNIKAKETLKDENINVEFHKKNLMRILKLYNEKSNFKDYIEYINGITEKCTKKRITNNFYQNIFPLEIQEDYHECSGQVIEKKTGTIHEKVYYYDMDKIRVIEYLDKTLKKCWFLYFYSEDEIMRLKFRDINGKAVLEGIKLEIEENDKKILYTYSNPKNERKVQIYFLNNECQPIFSKEYSCYNESIPIKNWIKEKWCKKKRYIYSKENTLLQIIEYDYSNHSNMIYSNFKNHFKDRKILDEFNDFVYNKTQHYSIQFDVYFKACEHRIILESGLNIHEEFVFLEEYYLDENHLQRFAILFALELYKKLEKFSCAVRYYVDDKEINIKEGDFILKDIS